MKCTGSWEMGPSRRAALRCKQIRQDVSNDHTASLILKCATKVLCYDSAMKANRSVNIVHEQLQLLNRKAS